MVAQFVAALEPAVSKVRLEAYRPAGADARDMAVNYFLNIELSEALYPSLQAFEIALRNSIHAALSQHFQAEFWFDQPGFLLTWQQGAIQNARDELTKYGKPHEAVLWHAKGSVLLDEVFPQLPRTVRTRQSVWDRCDQIRRLRNRVMHYEPIWSRPHLANEHTQILEALRWINTAMHDAIAMRDRFDQVIVDNRQGMERKVKGHLGIS
jgi:hypothetical protein